MPCYRLGGKLQGFICGKLGPACSDCGAVGGFLCDYPVGKGRTCDRSMCAACAREVAPNVHYCAGHLRDWANFEASGGVRRHLENVVPFQSSLFENR